MERGRQYKDKLDQISNEYSALHALLKRLIKSKQEAANRRKEFQQGWNRVSQIQESQELCNAFTTYAQAISVMNQADEQALDTLSNVIQVALREYSKALKQQRRSLSRHSRDAQREEQQDKTIADFQNTHVSGMKQLLLHLINAEMHQHTVALQSLSDRYQVFYRIGEE